MGRNVYSMLINKLSV